MAKQYRLNHAPASVWTNPLHFIACGFGVGAMPVMPGTFGSLAAIPFILCAARLSFWFYLIITVLVCVFCMWVIGRTDKDFGSHDHPATVSDEYAGMFVAFIGIPMQWQWLCIGFVLFRVFDIYKPWPISWADEKISGGFGVVFDDVLAGVAAWAIMWLMLRLGIVF